MKLTFIGAGYVGLVSAACFADVGNDVVCVDRDASKVDLLRQGNVPIYEQGLSKMLERSMKEGRLHFTTDLRVGLQECAVCFVAVDTPADSEGKADVRNVIAVGEAIGECLEQPLIVVTKSTVPVGMTITLKGIIQEKLRRRGKDPSWVRVASNPEFLKEGDAITDFQKPDRVIVGVEAGCDEVAGALAELYAPFMRKRNKFIKMDIVSAELSKYASNAMLAARVSFMNSLARLCEKVGGNIEQVREGMGTDPRIGPDYLFSGIGYGGSCFPKDVKALINMGKEYHEKLALVEATDEINASQAQWFFEKVRRAFAERGGLRDARVAVWGAAFKGNTDDIRDSQALKVVQLLLAEGATVRLFDPEALENTQRQLGDAKIVYCRCMYECVEGADALVICTDWNEFKSPDFPRIAKALQHQMIFDGRNLFSRAHWSTPWAYAGVGVSRKELS